MDPVSTAALGWLWPFDPDNRGGHRAEPHSPGACRLETGAYSASRAAP